MPKHVILKEGSYSKKTRNLEENNHRSPDRAYKVLITWILLCCKHANFLKGSDMLCRDTGGLQYGTKLGRYLCQDQKQNLVGGGNIPPLATRGSVIFHPLPTSYANHVFESPFHVPIPQYFNFSMYSFFFSTQSSIPIMLFFNTKKYHVFAPMGRFQLELIYLYFPPSFHLTVGCFCPVGLSML